MSLAACENDEVPEAGRNTITLQASNDLLIANLNKTSIEATPVDHKKKHQKTVRNYEAKLDAVWGGRTWLPPPEYSRRASVVPSGTDRNSISQNGLGRLVRLAELCQDAGVPVHTLYVDGGLLFEAAVELHGKDPLRWTTEVPKKALELFHARFTADKVKQSGTARNAAESPAPAEASFPPIFGTQSDKNGADLHNKPFGNAAADGSADNRDVVILGTETNADSFRPWENSSLTKELRETTTRLDSGQMLTDNCIDILQNIMLKAFPQSEIHIVHPLYFRPAAPQLPDRLPRAVKCGRKAEFLAAIHHNCHWVLARFSTKEACIHLWDPLPNSGALGMVKRAAVPWFEKMVSKSPVRVSILTGPKQDDGVNCGALVLLAMKHLLEGNDKLQSLNITGYEARATLSKLARDETSLCQTVETADTPPSPTRKNRAMSEPGGPSPITKRRKASSPEAALKPYVKSNDLKANKSSVASPANSISEIFASIEALGKPCPQAMFSAMSEVQQYRESLQVATQNRKKVSDRLKELKQQFQNIPFDCARVGVDSERTRNSSEHTWVERAKFRVPDDSSATTVQTPSPALTQGEKTIHLMEISMPAARAELEMVDVTIQGIKERLGDAEKRVKDHHMRADFWQMLHKYRKQT